jgi:dipeptidase E
MKQILRTLLLVGGFALATLAGAATPALHTSPKASVLVVGGAMMNGDHFADSTLATMRTHFAGCRRVALVLHASHPDERDAMEARLQKAFAHLGGIEASSLHRFDAAGARDLLAKADGIFVGGGETFVLLGELYRTGQLALIRERILAGAPYAGSSAGANIAGLLIGTTNDFPVAEIPTREALAVFPATINPHHPLPATKADFDARAGKIKAYLKFNPAETVLALANAAMARLHDGRVTVTSGAAWIYRSGGVRELKLGEVVPELTVTER